MQDAHRPWQARAVDEALAGRTLVWHHPRVRDFSIETRGPVGPAEGGSEDRPYQWRLIDADSREVVLTGTSPSKDLAILEARAQGEQLKRRGLFGTVREDLSALRDVVQRRPRETDQPPLGEPPADTASTDATLALAGEADEPSAPAVWSPDPMGLVRSLLPMAEGLPLLAETADELIDRAMAQVDADDAAIVLRDGETWRVVAGSGLRPLELRAQLTADHWLVETVYRNAQPLVVNNTDSVRPQLAGAPLASRKSLIVAPLAGLHALLLVARRDDPAFTESELRQVAELCLVLIPRLAEAIDVRDLARALDQFKELPA